MFREMRRGAQQLTAQDVEAVLDRCQHGVLACAGDDGYPLAVPLNYVYTAGRIYFHTARAGHKMDAIAADPKVSFAVIDQDMIVSSEYTSYYRSVIAFGRARIADGGERLAAFRALNDKYCTDRPPEERQAEVDRCERAAIVAIDIDHVTGKEAKELVEARQTV